MNQFRLQTTQWAMEPHRAAIEQIGDAQLGECTRDATLPDAVDEPAHALDCLNLLVHREASPGARSNSNSPGTRRSTPPFRAMVTHSACIDHRMTGPPPASRERHRPG